MAAVVNGAVNNITTCNPFTETELTWLSGAHGVAGSVCLVLILLILLLHRSWKGRSPNASEITPSRAHDDLLCHQALLSSAIPQTLTLYHILVASNPSVVLTEHHVTCEKVLKYLTKNPGLAVTS